MSHIALTSVNINQWLFDKTKLQVTLAIRDGYVSEKNKSLENQNWQFDRALHSEHLTELLSQVSSRNEFSRVGTSSEKDQKTRSDPNFCKTAITETCENKKMKLVFLFSIFVVSVGKLWKTINKKKINWYWNFQQFH